MKRREDQMKNFVSKIIASCLLLEGSMAWAQTEESDELNEPTGLLVFGEVGIGTGNIDLQASLRVQDQGTEEPAILIAGASASEGDIAVLNEETMQFGNWRASENIDPHYVNWLSLDTADVAPSSNNGNADETTLTRLRIHGDNGRSTIFHYSGLDNNARALAAGEDGPAHREELSIQASGDIVGRDNDGAGVHYYGKNDSQHAGAIGFFTDGAARLEINKQGRVGVGTAELLQDYESHLKGRFNIIKPDDEPGLYIEGASASEGDIAWRAGEALQLGVWTADNEFVRDDESPTGSFGEVLRLSSTGVISVNNPAEGDDSPGYFQLDTTSSAPPADDCNSANQVGRMTIHAVQQTMYVCSSSGWRSIGF